MKTNPLQSIATAFASVAVLICASCSTTPPPPAEHSTITAFDEGVPGGVAVDTFEITAKVTAVDRAKRIATLLKPDGKYTQFKAGPEVRNFDQIQVGDQVKATVTEELVVYVRDQGGRRTSDGQAGLVMLAPKGDKPGAFSVETVEITTRVRAVDLKNHKATLEFPDGSTRTVAVRPDVKLSTTDIGREVVIQATQAVAIRVEKP
jgi:hypothetical protein